jgi:hypothetical protein
MTKPPFIDPGAGQRWSAALRAIGAQPPDDASDPDVVNVHAIRMMQRKDRLICVATISAVIAAVVLAFAGALIAAR